MHLGQAHEQAVRERLSLYGWDVQPWGQGLLTDSIRASIQHQFPPVLWRWIPDLIAARGKRVWLIDPKSEQRFDTPNFTIEQSAYQAHCAMAVLGLRIVYVFADFRCNTPEGLKVVHHSIGDRQQTGGSGTPFLLIRKAEQFGFDEFFGPPPKRIGI